MKVKTKQVYYCDYCKKHGLSAGAMTTHEKHCTANSNRICRMCKFSEPMQPLIKKYKNQMSYTTCNTISGFKSYVNIKQPKLEDILDDVEGCPMCTLTIIRGTKLYEHPYHMEFDFKKLVDEWWSEKNTEEYEADMQDLVN